MRPSPTTSPFGALLDEIREAGVHDRAARATVPPITSRASARPEPDLHFEAGVVSGARRTGLTRPWRWVASLAINAAVLFGGVTMSLFFSDDLPEPAVGTTPLFVLPALPPPPPPPPAAEAREEAPRTRARRRAAPAAPSLPISARPAPAVPVEGASDASPSPDAEDVLRGGVGGGVPGGIVGGVMALEAEPAPESPRRRVRAGVDVKEPRRIKDAAPVYPEIAARGKIEGVVILELTIRPDGRVSAVSVLRGVPLLDGAAVAAAEKWVFAPTLLDGVPVSVTMTVPVRFALRDGPVRAAF